MRSGRGSGPGPSRRPSGACGARPGASGAAPWRAWVGQGGIVGTAPGARPPPRSACHGRPGAIHAPPGRRDPERYGFRRGPENHQIPGGNHQIPGETVPFRDRAPRARRASPPRMPARPSPGEPRAAIASSPPAARPALRQTRSRAPAPAGIERREAEAIAHPAGPCGSLPERLERHRLRHLHRRETPSRCRLRRAPGRSGRADGARRHRRLRRCAGDEGRPRSPRHEGRPCRAARPQLHTTANRKRLPVSPPPGLRNLDDTGPATSPTRNGVCAPPSPASPR